MRLLLAASLILIPMRSFLFTSMRTCSAWTLTRTTIRKRSRGRIVTHAWEYTPRITDHALYHTTPTSLRSASSSFPTVSETTQKLSAQDHTFLQQAVECAKQGIGHTFPNPAVGCVLVQHTQTAQSSMDSNDITQLLDENVEYKVVGQGFHPQAGYPHAEVFALLEAAGHVSDGLQAAASVLQEPQHHSDNVLRNQVTDLRDRYVQPGGPEALLGGCLKEDEDTITTAYVTLEPCCHYGQTPPCAQSMVLAHVDRVVIGYRDPNPKVNGGGMRILQEAGVQVSCPHDEECAKLVESFSKRLTPKSYDTTEYSWMTGFLRRQLRSMANRKKKQGRLLQMSMKKKQTLSTQQQPPINEADNDSDAMSATIDTMELDASWMEAVDLALWEHELIQLKLNDVVGKKKYAKRLGGRIATLLGGHIAQTIGHTALIYRPGIPPGLLDPTTATVIQNDDDDDNDDEDQ